MTTTTTKSKSEIAKTTAITKHQRAAEAATAAVAALRLSDPYGTGIEGGLTANEIARWESEAASQMAKALELSGVKEDTRTPQQIADEAIDKAMAASRSALVADRALRDAIAEEANPNDAPLTGGTITPGDNPAAAAEAAKAKRK